MRYVTDVKCAKRHDDRSDRVVQSLRYLNIGGDIGHSGETYVSSILRQCTEIEKHLGSLICSWLAGLLTRCCPLLRRESIHR